MDNFNVAIVVVNYNGYDLTVECLDSIFRSSFTNYSIALVDNGSTDSSGFRLKEKYLHNEKVHFISSSDNLGVTGGNNLGIDYALDRGCSHILFLNNDTIVSEDLVASLVINASGKDKSLSVPKIICYYDRERLDHWIGAGYNWWRSYPKGFSVYPKDSRVHNIARNDITVASTCCLMIPVELIRDIGKMDEAYFMYYDDADFTLRASNAGYRIHYIPQTYIYHKCNMTTRNKQVAFFEFYLGNRNSIYMYRKLCKNSFAKRVFYSKWLIMLLLQFIKNKKKRPIIKIIFRDVFSKRMGKVPAFN